jgi:arylsulfatase A-like enzyme
MLNLMVICVDSLRADIIGTGKTSSWIHTPVLDGLADESAVFANAWGEGQPTLPMRRGFFTGMRSYPWHHNPPDTGLSPALLGWHSIPSSHTTLAETLVAHGYLTGLVSDNYHTFKPGQNFTRGFLSWEFIRGQQTDNYRIGPLNEINIRAHVPDGEEQNWTQHYQTVCHLLNTRGRKREEDYFAPQVFLTASRWLRQLGGMAPFFLWVDCFMPHELWDPPARYADRYFPNDGSIKDYLHPGIVNRLAQPCRKVIDRTKALYAGCCTLVDSWIGYLFDSMDELRLWDDTVLVFLTDHGTELWDKGQFTKRAAFEGRLHAYNTQIEWFVRHPGAGRKQVSALVQSHDFVPTMLESLGLPPNELLDGRSAWPLLLDKAQELRPRVIVGWGDWASVRDNHWNCIVNATDVGAAPRLFDIKIDPEECDDVADDYPSVVADSRRYLEGLLGGPLPVHYKHAPKGGAMTLQTLLSKRRMDGSLGLRLDPLR